MVRSFPYNIWAKSIGDNDDAVFYDNCNSWAHIKCKDLNFIDYQYLNSNDDQWFCLKCNNEIFPLGTLNNKPFSLYIDDSNIQGKHYDKNNSCNLVLKSPPIWNSLFSQFSNSSQTHDFKDPEIVAKCKY